MRNTKNLQSIFGAFLAMAALAGCIIDSQSKGHVVENEVLAGRRYLSAAPRASACR